MRRILFEASPGGASPKCVSGALKGYARKRRGKGAPHGRTHSDSSERRVWVPADCRAADARYFPLAFGQSLCFTSAAASGTRNVPSAGKSRSLLLGRHEPARAKFVTTVNREVP